jgi:hypothetical protein
MSVTNGLLGLIFSGTKEKAEEIYQITAPELDEKEKCVLLHYLDLPMSDDFQGRYKLMKGRESQLTLISALAKAIEKIKSLPNSNKN